jgi:hypothetical protein
LSFLELRKWNNLWYIHSFHLDFLNILIMFHRFTICIFLLVTLVQTAQIAPVGVKVNITSSSLSSQAAVQSTINDLKTKWQGFINMSGGKRDQIAQQAAAAQAASNSTGTSASANSSSTTNNIITGSKNSVSGLSNVIEGTQNKITGVGLDVTGNENILKGMNSTVIGNKN